MKLKFKVQPYQTASVEAVADCFAGQPKSSGITYRVDPGTGPAPAPASPQLGLLPGRWLLPRTLGSRTKSCS